MLNKFTPRIKVASIYEIDLELLYQSGVRGIITDLDNTLAGAKEPLPSESLKLWLGQLKARGFEVVIVSNNNYERVRTFSEPLGIPFIHKAKKPTNRAFKQGMSIMGLSPQQTAVIGDQLLTDVLGGNRMGLTTILVVPIALMDEGAMTRFNRRIERYLFQRLNRRASREAEERNNRV